jgi:hypothetical protein
MHFTFNSQFKCMQNKGALHPGFPFPWMRQNKKSCTAALFIYIYLLTIYLLTQNLLTDSVSTSLPRPHRTNLLHTEERSLNPFL